jgi:hypothetical protein
MRRMDTLADAGTLNIIIQLSLTNIWVGLKFIVILVELSLPTLTAPYKISMITLHYVPLVLPKWTTLAEYGAD